jgi:hypothetical protein
MGDHGVNDLTRSANRQRDGGGSEKVSNDSALGEKLEGVASSCSRV